jgi:predicted nucleic acid-binding protein
LILVDSSVWIDFFSSAPGTAGRELRRMIAEAEPLALTGIIVSEILQGLTRDVDQIERHLRSWDLLEPTGFETYRNSAAIFRQARPQGFALTTTDALIAAIAMEKGVPLFTLDKDFARIARFTRLRLYRPR